MIGRPNNMKIRPVRLTIAGLQKRNVRQPKFEKSQSYNTLHFIDVTVLHHLTFHSEKVFNRYLFSKAEGHTNQSRLFYAFGNVHCVNVKPSIFDVIGRLSTTEYQ